MTTLRLIGSCPDQVGIVAEVASHIAVHGASITEAGQYEDHDSRTFFMRYVVQLPGTRQDVKAFRSEFEPIAKRLEMNWQLTEAGRRKRVVILVSKIDHCLAYLLHRWKVGDLQCDIACVISNHEAMRELVEWYRIPYHHIPVPKDPQGKQAAFRQTSEVIAESSPDVIVLARYMQIFPAWLCREYQHRVINIHHSFLPSFVGAKPYHQAVERGVKLIGATCHYVTEELDAGPIIEQDVVRVWHHNSLQDMIRLGKDVENVVLARGFRHHLEDRVIVHQNRTILFA
ncbi:MAG: formyltetrahydrofolate deformylase [Verrucomicrobiota bacterium]